LIYRNEELSYHHLSAEPTVIAEPRRDSTIVKEPGKSVELSIGQTVGLGMTTDGFGEIMWWYYFRIHSLASLKRAPQRPSRSR
jgi:hypothetical protein